MPTKVEYVGRSGNKLFQYVAARVFSEKNELNLITTYEDNIILTTSNKTFNNDKSSGYDIIINHNSFVNDEIVFMGHNKNYIFRDFFQNGDFMSNNYDLIKSFFILPEHKKNTKDIVIHLRLSDYLHFTDIFNPHSWDGSEIISPKYYTDILDTEKFDKLYIVVDKLNCEWEKKYLSYFDRYNPLLVSNSPKEDFEFIMSFNKIICSNSTFCYWAAFLSDAEKIYTFQNTGFYGKNFTKVGPHVKNLHNIKNKSISINEGFYFEF